MEQKKLIFNLSPQETIFNAIILMIIGQFIVALCIFHQLPTDFTLGKDFLENTNVPWYCDMPFTVLSIILCFSWSNYKFNIKPGDISWRAIKIRYIYTIGTICIFESLVKIIILYLLICLK